MKDIQTPQDTDWDRFWSMDQSRKFSKISWSKRRILNLLAPRCRSAKAVLDAGCGSGFFSKYFYERGLEVTALDYSESALKMAAKITEGGAKLVQADMVNDHLTDQLDSRFDLIFTDGLFEHFSSEDQDKIMENLISVLRPGGMIATFVPNRWSPWELVRPIYMPGIEEKPFMLHELVELHRRNDLAVLNCGGVNVLPFALSPEFLGSRFGMLLFVFAKKV